MRKLKLDELNRIHPNAYAEAPKHPVVVILDNIRSKNNVGAIFRTCDAFRVEGMLLCGYTPTPPHRDIAKTALGAETTVEWRQESDAVAAVQRLKAEGYRIACLEQAEGSTSLPDFAPTGQDKIALVLGNEVEGVQQAVIDIADLCLEIPQFGTKHSFNVSVAAGIALYGCVMPMVKV
ncbi:MAG: RNA methyltransferase [Bacteroidota bacterium]